MFNLLDERENDLSHGTETVLLAALKHISSTTQSRYFVNKAFFTTLLQHNFQHLRDCGLARARLLQLVAGRQQMTKESK